MTPRPPTAPARPSRIARLVACGLVGAFFAALPLWALSQQEGWVRIRGGGNPWRCTVTHSGLIYRSEKSYGPERIDAVEGTISANGRSRPAWQLELRESGGRVKLLAGESTDGQLVALARELEQARAQGSPIDRALPPDSTWFLTLGIAVVFAAAGVALVLAR